MLAIALRVLRGAAAHPEASPTRMGCEVPKFLRVRENIARAKAAAALRCSRTHGPKLALDYEHGPSPATHGSIVTIRVFAALAGCASRNRFAGFRKEHPMHEPDDTVSIERRHLLVGGALGGRGNP